MLPSPSMAPALKGSSDTIVADWPNVDAHNHTYRDDDGMIKVSQDSNPYVKMDHNVLDVEENTIASDSEWGDCDEESSTSKQKGPVRPPVRPRVRFRSRVRITSGIHKVVSPKSSRSASFSSSISAPLRWREENKPGWGPLGRRVSLLAGNQEAAKRERLRRKLGMTSISPSDERSPLLRVPNPTPEPDLESDEDLEPDRDAFDAEEDADAEEQLSREVDVMFGTWPRRLLNQHWWWWQMESLFCCQMFTDDSETED